MASLVAFGSATDAVRVQRAASPSSAGEPVAPREAAAEYVSIGSDYFRSLGLRVLRGREFTRGEAEGLEAKRAAIIDEPAARRLFPSPDEEPIGQMVVVGSSQDGGPSPALFEVVGVVPGVRASLADRGPRAHLYVPFSARTRAWMNYHVRVAPGSSAEACLPQLRQALAAVDPRLPVMSARTLESFVHSSVFLWFFRSGARVFTAFGLSALVLALVGIYGVSAYTVARRRREIGIRMALGASPAQVLRLIVRETAIVTMTGLVAGTALAIAIGSVLGSMLYEVTAFDPVALSAGIVLLGGAALAASYVPARGATRVPVVSAIRTQ